MNRVDVFKPLAYAGALPFIGCALLVNVGVWTLPYLGSMEYVAAAYALAIISFLAGTHWSLFLLHSDRIASHLLVSSNIITVSAWLGFLLLTAGQALWVAIAAFISLLYFDYRIAVSGLVPSRYFETRRNVTAIVILCLLLTWSAL